MNNTITRLAACVSLGVAALAAAPLAQAATVNYTFVVSNFSAGGSQSAPLSGSFSYDDAQVPMDSFNADDLYALNSFSFVFDGQSYGVADVLGGAVFAVGSSNFLGLELDGATFSFLPADFVSGATFSYDLGGGGDAGQADVRANLNVVPEPAMGVLLAVALLGLAATRRGRAQR